MQASRRHPEVLRLGELEIHPAGAISLGPGDALRLSGREFQLLVALAERTGRIVSREELHTVVWGGDFRKEDRSVDVYVSKLRTKLEAALPAWRFIHTHFGFGYRLAPEPSHPFHTRADGRPQTAIRMKETP
jgi:DNA-binding response OmpR family regulator